MNRATPTWCVSHDRRPAAYGRTQASRRGRAIRCGDAASALDSPQLTSAHKVATPADWRPGEKVIIAGSVTDEQAKNFYPAGRAAPVPYLRILPQPQ